MVDSSVPQASQEWLNPTSNPSLVLDTEGKKNLAIYTSSISVGATIVLEGSHDNTNYFKVLTALTDTNKEYFDVIGFGWRYARITILETGVGTEKISMSAK